VSDELIGRYREMAEGGMQFFGLSIVQHAKQIGKLVKQHDAHSILDYGSGRGDAYVSPHQIHLNWGIKRAQITLYDPAFRRYAKKPGRVYDAVLCSDVLEHVPEEGVDELMRDLIEHSAKFVWASVCCRPARKSFPGTDINLHVTVKPFDWWLDRMQAANTAGRIFYLVETP
jgi:hypothetical protein